MCTSEGFVRFVDPEGPCVATGERAKEKSPCKQLTPFQYENMKKTDFVMTWDKDGWLTDVGVRGMPRIEGIVPIPRKAIMFAYWDQATVGTLTYCRDAGHPGILTYSPIGDDGNITVYKQWNADMFPPGVDSKRLPAFAVPRYLADLLYIASTMFNRVKDIGNRKILVKISQSIQIGPDVAKIVEFWRRKGYQAGYITIDNQNTAFFAYRHGNLGVALFDADQIPRDITVDQLAEQVEFTDVEEPTPLSKLGLSNRCIVCGYPNIDEFGVTYPCHYCLRKVSTIVFEPKKK